MNLKTIYYYQYQCNPNIIDELSWNITNLSIQDSLKLYHVNSCDIKLHKFNEPTTISTPKTRSQSNYT
jgi:hypothetical protein